MFVVQLSNGQYWVSGNKPHTSNATKLSYTMAIKIAEQFGGAIKQAE